MSEPVILASTSAVRARLLRNAGVAIEILPARVDEEEIKAALMLEGLAPRDIADQLAEAKAQKISNKIPGALVIGVDQVLEFDGRFLSKAENRAELATQLGELSGRVHRLYSAAVISHDGAPIWRHIARVEMQMRELTPEFIDTYIAAYWDEVRHSVGGYHFEGAGVQLFAAYKGDYYAVLGLPLVQILDFLRVRGVLGR